MTKSLVTGGAGFIGVCLTNALIKQKHQMILIDDLSGDFEENISPLKGSTISQQLLEGPKKIISLWIENIE